MTSKYHPPDWVEDHISATAYNKWLTRKARSLHKRDKKRDGSYSISDAKVAIHAAMIACNGLDHWTGELLRADLIGTYNNDESKARRADYKREFDFLPTVDHLISNPVCDFVICGWRTNDMKHDRSIDELKDFCRLVLEHNPPAGPSGPAATTITVGTTGGPVVLVWDGDQPITPTGDERALAYWRMAVEAGLHGPFGHSVDLSWPPQLVDLVMALQEKVAQGLLVRVESDGEVPPLNYPANYGQPGVCT